MPTERPERWAEQRWSLSHMASSWDHGPEDAMVGERESLQIGSARLTPCPCRYSGILFDQRRPQITALSTNEPKLSHLSRLTHG